MYDLGDWTLRSTPLGDDWTMAFRYQGRTVGVMFSNGGYAGVEYIPKQVVKSAVWLGSVLNAMGK